MITIATAFNASMRKSKKLVLVAQIQYGTGDYITVSSGKVPKLDGETYRPLLAGVPTLQGGFEFEEFDVEIQDIRLKFNNPDQRLSDLITDTSLGSGSNIGFYNRDCELKLWAPGITSFANCIEYYKGPTREILDHDILRFDIEDHGQLFYAAGFAEVLDGSDAASGEGGILPEESFGSVKPDIYGAFTSKAQSTDPDEIEFFRPTGGIECEYQGLDDTGKHRWLVAGHTMESIDGDDIWGFDPALKRAVKIDAVTVEQNTAAGCIISHADGVSFQDFWYPNGNNGTPVVGAGGTVSNEENMGDKDNDTKGTLTAPDSATSPAGSANVTVLFPAYVNGGTISQVGVLARADFQSTTPANALNALINSVDAKGADGTSYDAFGNMAASEAGGGAAVTVSMVAGTNKTPQITHTLDVYMIRKRIIYVPTTQRLQLFSTARGTEYGTWINSRAGHPDNNDSGLLIENPFGVIEGVHRNQYGLVDADINETAFDAAATELSAWKFAGNVAAEETDLVAKLGKDSMSVMVYNGAGKATPIVVKDEYAASNIVVNINDVLTRGNLFTRSKTGNILSTATVEYNVAVETGENNLKESFTNATVLTQYGLTAAQATKKFPTRFINDQATALLLATKLQKFWQNHHNIFAGLLPLKYIGLEAGDIIEFKNVGKLIYGEDITDNATTRMGQQIFKYFKVTNFTKTDENIKIEAWQMHDLS